MSYLEKIIPLVAYIIVRAICSTLRIKIHNVHYAYEQIRTEGTCLFVFWHRNLFLMPYVYRKVFKKRPLSILVSKSRDGEYIADSVKYFHVDAVRGSSSKRGSKAFKELLEKIEQRYDVAITPDGPRGPRLTVHMGVLKLSQISGKAMIPVLYSGKKIFEFNSWDRFKIPLPFSKVDFYCKKPISVPFEIEEENLKGIKNRLAKVLGE